MHLLQQRYLATGLEFCPGGGMGGGVGVVQLWSGCMLRLCFAHVYNHRQDSAEQLSGSFLQQMQIWLPERTPAVSTVVICACSTWVTLAPEAFSPELLGPFQP